MTNIISDPRLTRRRAVALLGTAAAGLTLSACSESEAQTASGSVDFDKLVETAPLEDKWLGPDDAKVTIVEYASATCPHCATFHTTVFGEIKEKYIDTGKVRFAHREFPFDNLALAAFMLARCAPNDGYYPMLSVLYQRQRAWARSENPKQALFDIAKLSGMDQEAFETCLRDQTLVDGINAVRNAGAQDFDVDATPTFFINGTKYSGGMSVEQMSTVIDDLL
ncbi:MAG: DsbA family protein [Pseudomonadota bacterium]